MSRVVPSSSPSPLPPSPPVQGVLLFAHGARDPRWSAPFEAVAERLRGARPDCQVRLAYLEFMSPGLVEAGAALAAAGCGRVTVAPLFLGAGGHVRKDLPALLDQLRALHPDVAWTLMPAIGEIDSVTLAMAQAVAATVPGEGNATVRADDGNDAPSRPPAP